MNRIAQNIKLKYSIDNKIYHYSGKVISEDLDFIELDEIKEGVISLNKRNIILIEKNEQNGDEQK